MPILFEKGRSAFPSVKSLLVSMIASTAATAGRSVVKVCTNPSVSHGTLASTNTKNTVFTTAFNELKVCTNGTLSQPGTPDGH